jgi:hypothetical protein
MMIILSTMSDTQTEIGIESYDYTTYYVLDKANVILATIVLKFLLTAPQTAKASELLAEEVLPRSS